MNKKYKGENVRLPAHRSPYPVSRLSPSIELVGLSQFPCQLNQLNGRCQPTHGIGGAVCWRPHIFTFIFLTHGPIFLLTVTLRAFLQIITIYIAAEVQDALPGQARAGSEQSCRRVKSGSSARNVAREDGLDFCCLV